MTGYSVLSTALSGLAAAQRAMDVTSQNIVNANTPGYSRQLVRQSSVAPSLVANVWTGGNATTVGGVQLDHVVRVRDSFLEANRASAGGAKSALDAQTGALQGVETLITEPSDDGLQSNLDEFYASWGTLANTGGGASTSAAGAVVIAKGQAVTAQLNTVATGITNQWNTSLGGLKSTIGAVNDAASQLAALNQQIVSNSDGGDPVNELLDKRDQLVRTLGELAGGVASLQADGTASVAIGGATVVAGNQSVTLSVGGGSGLSDVATDPPTVLANGTVIDPPAGTAAGLLAAVRTDLPQVMTQLDQTAVALRDAVNTVHGSGYTPAGAAAGDFFTGSSALTMSVVPTDASQLGTSSGATTTDSANAQAIANLSEDDDARSVLGGAGPSEQWRALASGLGSKLQGLTSATAAQKTILDAADAAVQSDAGVNLDEEMTNLLMYQRAYQASTKVITAIDEMMDTLINRTNI